MKAYTYIEPGKFALVDKKKPELQESTDAIVRVTLGSICTSDLHIKHGSVPRAVPGITVGHEMVGVVEQIGSDVKGVKPGDRVTVNVETFCGECFYCKHGYVNNCTSSHGGWALGCLSLTSCSSRVRGSSRFFVGLRSFCIAFTLVITWSDKDNNFESTGYFFSHKYVHASLTPYFLATLRCETLFSYMSLRTVSFNSSEYC